MESRAFQLVPVWTHTKYSMSFRKVHAGSRINKQTQKNSEDVKLLKWCCCRAMGSTAENRLLQKLQSARGNTRVQLNDLPASLFKISDFMLKGAFVCLLFFFHFLCFWYTAVGGRVHRIRQSQAFFVYNLKCALNLMCSFRQAESCVHCTPYTNHSEWNAYPDDWTTFKADKWIFIENGIFLRNLSRDHTFCFAYFLRVCVYRWCLPSLTVNDIENMENVCTKEKKKRCLECHPSMALSSECHISFGLAVIAQTKLTFCLTSA